MSLALAIREGSMPESRPRERFAKIQLRRMARTLERTGQELTQVHINLRDFAATTATVATIVGSIVVLHPPFIPYVRWIAVVYAGFALILFLFGFLAQIRWQEHRARWIGVLHSAVAEILEVKALDALLLMLASAVLFIGSLSWPAPGNREIAQQMLSDRGMSLTRQDFKQALELGNTNGVELFLKAGFSPVLAVHLLGESAETISDGLAVDALFAQNADARYAILGYLAQYRQEDAEHSGNPERLASVFNLPLGHGGASEEDETPDSLNRPPRIDLLGHALLTDSRAAIELLSLGADPYLSLGMFLDPGADTDEATAQKEVQLPWEAATNVYRYAVSQDAPRKFGNAAVATMIEQGVAPGFCNKGGECDIGKRFLPLAGIHDENCKVDRLRNEGKALILIYPDSTLRDVQAWEFDPYDSGEHCSGHTASYFGQLLNPATGRLVEGTLRVLGGKAGSGIYLVESERSDDTASAPYQRFLGWRDNRNSRAVWTLGNLDGRRGVIVDSQILWSDMDLDQSRQSEEPAQKCENGSLLLPSASSIELSCQKSFSLRSIGEAADTLFEVAQVNAPRLPPVYWHAADDAEVHFIPGTYIVRTHASPANEDTIRLGVAVQEIELNNKNFLETYTDLPREADLTGTVEPESPLYAGLAVSSAALLSVRLSDLEADIDLALTDTQGNLIDGSFNASNEDEQMEVLLWPGQYLLAIEANAAASSGFSLALTSQAPTPITAAFDKTGQVGAGSRFIGVLDVTDPEAVTVRLSDLSADAIILLFDENGDEIGSHLVGKDTDDEIKVDLWSGQYILEIDALNRSDYRLRVSRETPELDRMPIAIEDTARKGEEYSVWFEIAETTTVKASLSQLQADLDLKVEGSSGEVARSLNRETENEWLEVELAPGNYVMIVTAVDAGSDFLLEVRDDPEWSAP